MSTWFKENEHIIQAISNYIESDISTPCLNEKTKRMDLPTITPRVELIFSAFYLVSFDPYGLHNNSLKVVLLFQDIYPTAGAACGVALASLNDSVQSPLLNFYHRIQDTYINTITSDDGQIAKVPYPDLTTGDIRGWCTQGVLMLNSSLTTRVGELESHIEEWSMFTMQLIKYLSETFPFLVFGLFGKRAQKYKKYINSNKHSILETSHPTKRGNTYGFGQCNIFNEINECLVGNLREAIQWQSYKYV